MKLSYKQMQLLLKIIEEKSDSVHKELMATENEALGLMFSEILELQKIVIQASRPSFSISVGHTEEESE